MSRLRSSSHIWSAGQLPAFVREEYPGFVTFMEAYYRFLEQRESATGLFSTRHLSWIDVDTTLDAFVQRKMRGQYAADISETGTD
jgi:hypothetical protein